MSHYQFGRWEDGASQARRARVERLRHDDAWSASGTVDQFAALRAIGFEPVGQVFGASVQHVTAPTRFTSPGCTFQTVELGDALLGLAKPRADEPQVVESDDVRRAVIAWAVAECRALGGDGIVGMKVRMEPNPDQGTQITVEGTAVRAHSRLRPPRPFTTHVSGPDFARLLGGGWMPISVVIGRTVGCEHDDMGTRFETRPELGSEGNMEVQTFTRLVNKTRRAAREHLAAAVSALGGQGVIIDELTLRVSKRECSAWEGEHDHMAEAGILGSALVALPRRKRTAERRALTILRLDRDPQPVWQAPRPI